MRERIHVQQRGLYIQFPGLVTSSFLERLGETTGKDGDRPYDLPTKRVRVNDTELHYFEFGAGDPVVFVHGFIADYCTWGYQFEPFAQDYRVISYSRRYHYPNEWNSDGSDYSLGLHTDDLAAFIAALDHGPAHIIGTSVGANIAADCASRYPDVTRSLVVNEPDLQPWLADLEGGRALHAAQLQRIDKPASAAIAAGDWESAIRAYVDGVLGEGAYAAIPPERRAVMLDNIPSLKAELAALAYFSPFTFDDAARIRAPTLLLQGGITHPVYRLMADKFADCVPNLERAVVEGVAHAAPTFAPDRFNELVLGFLARHHAQR